MKIVRLFLLLLIAGLFLIPAVSAQDYEKTLESNDYNYAYMNNPGITSSAGIYPLDSMVFSNMENCQNMRLVRAYADTTLKYGSYDSYGFTVPAYPVSFDVTYSIDGVYVGRGNYNSFKNGNMGYVALTFDEWDVSAYTGQKTVKIAKASGGTSELVQLHGVTTSNYNSWSPDNLHRVYFMAGGYKFAAKHETYTTDSFKNAYTLKDDKGFYTLELKRDFDGKTYGSYLYVKSGETVLVPGTSYRTDNYKMGGLFDNPIVIGVKTPSGKWFNDTYTVSGGTIEQPESSTVTVYVRSSQTNARIADARVVIESGYNDPAQLLVVSNTTLPSGTKTYTLQPTGGGLPNPDYYRVSVTADGYNAEMPYADIELEPGVSMTMVMGMQPTGGAPEDPGDTYIDVYVRDIYANPIADATVKMGVYTLKTNAAGYTVFDVPVNSTYAYTVKKTGYTTIEGSVSVDNAARYTVNVVMGTGVIPTNTPTAEPTVPGATPTVPAGEETPGPGFIDQSAKNFSTFLGVSYAVGRAALGMLIATAIGFTTARKLKGGAPEFGIGFIAGAALMVLMTLLPAWIFIVMVIIVGGLLGYKYMSGGS